MISAVVVKNRGNVADVWLFKSYEDVPTLRLMLLTSLAAVVTWWMLWGLRRLIRDWRALQTEDAVEAKAAEQKRLAEELAVRERRIDEKIKGSISEEN